MKPASLFNPENFPPLIRYEKLFKNLPPLEEASKQRGRPPFPKETILKALIYRNLRGLPSLADLAFELENNPLMAEVLGFPAFERPPSKERFSCFLRTTVNQALQCIRLGLVRALKDEKVISGHIIALDFSAIEANVRENNLKPLSKIASINLGGLKEIPALGWGLKSIIPSLSNGKLSSSGATGIK